MRISKKFVLYPVSGLLISGAVAAGSLAGASWLNSGTGSGGVTTGTLTPDTIGGSGSGLVPASTANVVVTVHNNTAGDEYLVSITPGAITATPKASSTDTPAPADISVAPWAGHVRITAGGSVNETLVATMVANPAGAQGDSYSVALTSATTTSPS